MCVRFAPKPDRIVWRSRHCWRCNYEVRVAAFIAVKMLSGNQCQFGMESMARNYRQSHAASEPWTTCRESARRHEAAFHFGEGTAQPLRSQTNPAFTDT